MPGSPENSRLIRAIKWTDNKFQMPPKKAMPPEKVGAGRAVGKDEVPDPAPARRPPPPTAVPFEEAKKFWSYQPVQDRRCRP